MAPTNDDLLEEFLVPIRIDVQICDNLAAGFYDCFKALAANPTDQFLPTPISDSILRPIADTGCGRNLAIDIGGTNLRVGFIELLGKQEQTNGVNGVNGVHAINGTNGTAHTNGTEHANGTTHINGTTHTNGVSDTESTTDSDGATPQPPSRIRRLFEKSWAIDEKLKDDNAEALFRWIGKHIAEVVGDAFEELGLSSTEPLPMGVTFSFPAQQHSLAEATVTSMGKGFTIAPNTDLGVSLETGYAQAKAAHLPGIKVTAISNDSVSTLVSFIYNFGQTSDQRASMGLILGTGSNATVPLKMSLLHQSKWPKNINVLDGESLSDVKIAVNTEWSISGTAPPMRKLGIITSWDDQLSAQNEKPGFQPLEYMTAGRYLGELGRIMLVDYMVNTLRIARETLPAALLQRHGLSTTFLSNFKPLQTAELVWDLRTEFPESTGTAGFEWTEHLAEALYRIAKAIEVRAAGIIAAGTFALLTLSEELPDSAASAITGPKKELGVGYTGGCIVHFQDYLLDCQWFMDELMERRFGYESTSRVVLSPCHDGGITGAGILVSAASSSKKTEAAGNYNNDDDGDNNNDNNGNENDDSNNSGTDSDNHKNHNRYNNHNNHNRYRNHRNHNNNKINKINKNNKVYKNNKTNEKNETNKKNEANNENKSSKTNKTRSSPHSASPGETVELPEDLNSYEFLIWVAFDEDTARSIYNRWKNWDQSIGAELIDFALGHVDGQATVLDADDEGHDWEGALTGMGVNDRLREAIMDPRFKDIRCTESASFWVKNTIDEGYDFLAYLEKRMEALRTRRLLGTNTPDDLIQPLSVVDDSGTPPSTIEGRTMYFKGGTEAQLLQSVHNDGSVDLNALASSTAPTDFHPTKRNCVYLFKDKVVAEKYAGYIGERVPSAKAAVLCIALPSALPNMTEIHGGDWRKLVWACRNRRAFADARYDLPFRLRRYEEAGILLGSVCGDATSKIQRMSDMSELTEMRRPGDGASKAVQLVIQRVDARKAIEKQCCGFAWVSSVARRRG